MKKLNNQKGAGAVVGIIIIIIVLLVGAIYFFGQTSQMNQPALTGQSDDVTTLQQDASSMNFDTLGSGADTLQ